MPTLYRLIAFSLAIAVVLGLLIGLAACDDGIVDSDLDPDPDPVQDNEPLPELPGDPDASVVEVTYDFSADIEISDEEVSMDPETDAEIVRTYVQVRVKNNVTVSEANDLLKKYEAYIALMLPNRPFLGLQIPYQDDLDKLRKFILDLEDERIVESVVKGELAVPDKIPEHLNPIEDNIGKVDHHLAVRAHAAWNLQSAIKDAPWLIIVDYFGNGVPDERYSGISVNYDDYIIGDPDLHGYFVLGVINASFDKVPGATGIFPGNLNIRAIDTQSYWNNISFVHENKIVSTIADIIDIDENANILVNTSLGHAFVNRIRGEEWYNKVNPESGLKLENRFLHFASAGNLGERDPFPAYQNSSWNYSALGPRMSSYLMNTLAIENRMTTRSAGADVTGRPKPDCTYEDSVMGAGLSAIGTDVYSLAESGVAIGSGTSASAPQAAGTAAYMWAVNPALGVNDIIEILQATSRSYPVDSSSGPCRSRAPSRIIDTYDAVLAAGGSDVRLALLDVTESGSFDEQDIEVFLSEWESADGMLDYSRYDLNGTGQTGGDATDRFDLNHDIFFGSVTKMIEGEEVMFDETDVTDKDILCYYAYSLLYDGEATERSDLLSGHCSNRMPGAIYTASRDGEVHRVSPSGDRIWSYTGHSLWVHDVAVDTDGYIYSGAGDSELHKISPDGEQSWVYEGLSGFVLGVEVDRDGFVYGVSSDGELHKLSPGGQRIWAYNEHSESVNGVAVDSEGFIYSVSLNGEVHKINPDGMQIWTYGDTYAWDVAVDGDNFIYTAGLNEVHKLSSKGKRIWEYTGHNGQVRGVAVDSDGFVYTAADDQEVNKLSPEGERLWAYTGHSGPVVDVAVDDQGFVYSTSTDNELHMLTQSGDRAWSYSGHGNWVTGVAIYPSPIQSTDKRFTVE
jgi:sugar lactone lactonase YvrE